VKIWLIVFAFLCALPLGAQDLAPHVVEAKSAIKALSASLQKEMKLAMMAGGPLEAIGTCNLKALPLTEQISQQQGLAVSRTSLKYRNEQNMPDGWELKVLLGFEEKLSQGQEIKNMSYAEIVEEQGQKFFRMMKAIPVKQQCLACHGAEIVPELNSKIEKLYPQDLARGFKVGEIRGAFSVKKKI